jgi:DNA replication and repair protein RecF
VYLTRLALTDYRSYEAAELALRPGVTVFHGPNGQGKTNLVEAIDYLATGRSHRVATDHPLVRAGTPRATVSGAVVAGLEDSRTLTLDVEINASGANRVRLNGAPRRPRDIAGAVRVVFFAPGDIALVNGDPAERRRFIDELMTTRWPRLAGVRADYDRALKQRNALLKGLAAARRGGSRWGSRGPAPAWNSDGWADSAGGSSDSPADEGSLSAWDDRLVHLGAEIIAARLRTLDDICDSFAEHYDDIAPTPSLARVRYRSAIWPGWEEEFGTLAAGEGDGDDDDETLDGPVIPDALDPLTDVERLTGPRDVHEIETLLRERIAQRRDDELIRGVTLVGPHRDDLVLTLGDLPAKGYASHGESWSVAVALRLASLDVLIADDLRPILVLDDVFAELDEVRRSRVAHVIGSTDQVFITAAVLADLPPGLEAEFFEIGRGTVTPRGSSGGSPDASHSGKDMANSTVDPDDHLGNPGRVERGPLSGDVISHHPGSPEPTFSETFDSEKVRDSLSMTSSERTTGEGESHA